MKLRDRLLRMAERKALRAVAAVVERELDRRDEALAGTSHRLNVFNSGYWVELTPYKRAGLRAVRRYLLRSLSEGG